MGVGITHKEFSERLRNISPEIEIVGEYVNMRTKILVRDKNKGEYLSTPAHLLEGRTPTIRSAVDKNKVFKIKSRKVHGDKYDYSKVKYVDSYTKVIVVCPMHGEFCQTPSNHLLGSGCYGCGLESISESRIKNK